MTHQATVPPTGTTAEPAPSGQSIGSMVGYALSIMLVVITVVAAIAILRDDPIAAPAAGAVAVDVDGSFQANETGRLEGLAPSIAGGVPTVESGRSQELVNGIDPTVDVAAALGLTAIDVDGSFQANETERFEGLRPGGGDLDRTLWTARHR